MIVFRITTHQWCNSLTASGNPARWNARGHFVIYTAGSRSLACLENMVYRSGEGNSLLYKVMVIEIPDNLEMEVIDTSSIIKDWYTTKNYTYCQSLGIKWLNECRSAVLRVPSVIIKKEQNYLVNPNHPDFKRIKMTGNEDFDFDSRF